VNRIFDFLDKKNLQQIEPIDLISNFDASKHPFVLMKKKTQDAVLKEFSDFFDVGNEVNGKITRDEFVNYFTNIAASMQDDDFFELVLRKTWNVNENETMFKGVGKYDENGILNKNNNKINNNNESKLVSKLKDAQNFANNNSFNNND
jgi:hypothetical protein